MLNPNFMNWNEVLWKTKTNICKNIKRIFKSCHFYQDNKICRVQSMSCDKKIMNNMDISIKKRISFVASMNNKK